MPEEKLQDLKNHTRFDPLFHFLMLPVGLTTVLIAAYDLTQRQHFYDIWFLVMSVTILIAFFKIRTYPLKVQDRVIRLEEQLRMQRLLPETSRARAGQLKEGQLVALRFASDAELPGLVEKTLANNWTNKEIKQKIVAWRPDCWRV